MEGDKKIVVYVFGVPITSMLDPVNGMEKSSIQEQLAACTVEEESGSDLFKACT